jgi:hypothetical protein
MEPECSLPCSQQAAHLLPYSKPDNPFHSLSSYFIKVLLNVRSYSCLDLPGGPFPSRLRTKNSVCLSPPPSRCIISRPSHGLAFDRLYNIYLAGSTNHQNFHYAILCHIFLRSFSAHCSRKH